MDRAFHFGGEAMSQSDATTDIPAGPDRTLAAPDGGLRHVRSDIPFFGGMIALGGVYLLLIVGMLAAMCKFSTLDAFVQALASEEIRYSIRLSLLSCFLTTILSLWVAVPIGYLMSRYSFPGKGFVDALLDIPIVLPPLVIGLALLILFHLPLPLEPTPILGSADKTIPWTLERLLNEKLGFSVTFAVPAVILAQFMVACAFAVRTMRVTFDQITPRREQVALTLGCTRSQAFWMVVFPESRRGLLTAGTLAWARSLGEFGPVLVFAGATRMRTEVLPTTVFLELSTGKIEAATAVSLIMVVAAVVVLVVARLFGLRGKVA
jgi:molybdate transport system permease protein